MVNEIIDIGDLCREHGCVEASKQQIFGEADVISLHVPLTRLTRDMIAAEQLAQMKPSALVVNTSRGGIINEADLCRALERGVIAGAAVDVFEEEPYHGPLLRLENCVLSCHLGSCTQDCRFAMELQAVEDGLRFIRGEPLKDEVPEQEYENQRKP
jgi:D-3-phosphoglycerate dehydrogenase